MQVKPANSELKNGKSIRNINISALQVLTVLICYQFKCSCNWIIILFAEEERKLFVGMLPKNMADEDLKKEMLPFGAIEDCVILRDRDGNSKGKEQVLHHQSLLD